MTITDYVVVPMKPRNTNVRAIIKAGSNIQFALGNEEFSAFYFIYFVNF